LKLKKLKFINVKLLKLIKDNDFRVRNHVSELLPDFIENISVKALKNSSTVANNFTSFLDENLLQFEALFVDLKNQNAGNAEIGIQLTRFLYTKSNFLLDINDKNKHFVVIYTMKGLALSFIIKNPGIALDISCQCDMLEVISTIIGANVVSGSSKEFNEFLHHLMRILNIYGHLEQHETSDRAKAEKQKYLHFIKGTRDDQQFAFLQ
jgi:hypothetical protein